MGWDWCGRILACLTAQIRSRNALLDTEISFVSHTEVLTNKDFDFIWPPLGSSHNYLRISRILKSLSEFGLEYLNAGFLLHALNEQSEFNELNTQGFHSSMDRWWANCIRNEDERKWIGDIIRKVRAGGYTFTREMYEEALDRRTQTGNLAPASWKNDAPPISLDE